MSNVINRQIVDFTFHNESRGKLLQKEFSDRILPVWNKKIAETIDKLNFSDATILIDKIEIDLGDIDLSEIESSQISEKLQFQFADNLSKYVSKSQELTLSNYQSFSQIQIGNQLNDEKVLLAYLQTGNLPWHTDGIELNALFHMLLKEKPDFVKQLYNDSFHSKVYKSRIEHFFNAADFVELQTENEAFISAFFIRIHALIKHWNIEKVELSGLKQKILLEIQEIENFFLAKKYQKLIQNLLEINAKYKFLTSNEVDFCQKIMRFLDINQDENLDFTIIKNLIQNVLAILHFSFQVFFDEKWERNDFLNKVNYNKTNSIPEFNPNESTTDGTVFKNGFKAFESLAINSDKLSNEKNNETVNNKVHVINQELSFEESISEFNRNESTIAGAVFENEFKAFESLAVNSEKLSNEKNNETVNNKELIINQELSLEESLVTQNLSIFKGTWIESLTEGSDKLKEKYLAWQNVEEDIKQDTKSMFLQNNARQFHIANAGLCLLAVYLPAFLKELGLTDGPKFKTFASVNKAIFLLQKMVENDIEPAEFELPFNKLLCGLDIFDPIGNKPKFTESECTAIDELLQSIISNWSILKNTSIDGFRKSFLKRNGILTEKEKCWVLQVEQQSQDILLDSLPWGFQIIKLPWMTKFIQVEW